MTDTLPSEKPNRLYRYMSNMDYITDMLVHNRFYLSNPFDFNDPFDSDFCLELKGDENVWRDYCEQFFVFTDREYTSEWVKIRKGFKNSNNRIFLKKMQDIFLGIDNLTTLMEKKDYIDSIVIDAVLEEAKKFNFNVSKNILSDGFFKRGSALSEFYRQCYSAMKNACNSIRILCFSNSYDQVLLWSHYAHSHQGVCFGFDVINDKDNYENKYLDGLRDYLRVKPVKYADSRYAFDFFDKHRKEGDEFIFHKYYAWKYEEEYRLLQDTSMLEIGSYLSFNKKILSEVIFGMSCNNQMTDTIISLVKKYYGDEVKFYKARAHINEYKVVNEVLDVSHIKV